MHSVKFWGSILQVFRLRNITNYAASFQLVSSVMRNWSNTLDTSCCALRLNDTIANEGHPVTETTQSWSQWHAVGTRHTPKDTHIHTEAQHMGQTDSGRDRQTKIIRMLTPTWYATCWPAELIPSQQLTGGSLTLKSEQNAGSIRTDRRR